jgi:ferrochelatase
VVLAAYSSYSSCRQYREDIERARADVGPSAPLVDKTRVFYNHPEFIAANTDRVREALAQVPADARACVHVAFTAHSIPLSMADNCSYQEQLEESCRLVALELRVPSSRYRLVYQSRSGRPQDPWLEPDLLDHLRSLKSQSVAHVIIHPIGFLSDHMEVLYDLDEEAKHLCEELGLSMVRSRTVGTHRGFVRMLRELIEERVAPAPIEERRASGQFGPSHDTCPVDCCLSAARSPSAVVPPASPGLP